MIQLILEQLVNGTQPASISPNIVSQDSLDIPGVKVIIQKLPSINFICSFRTIIRIIDEILVAYHIGKLEQQDQLFSVGTDRCQTDLHSLVIGVIDEERLRILILSTSIILY